MFGTLVFVSNEGALKVRVFSGRQVLIFINGLLSGQNLEFLEIWLRGVNFENSLAFTVLQ